MENIANELDENRREPNKLDVIKRQLFKTTDFLRTGYQNRQRKKVAPLMTNSEENEPDQKKPAMRDKTKLVRKTAINFGDFQPPVLTENQDESSEDEDDWDSLSVSDTEYKDEELFRDVYHQCTNIVGQDISNEFGKNALVGYLKREIFDFCDHKCETLIRSVDKKYPKLILKVELLEAKDIFRRDVFSVGDLFYVIWMSSNPRNYYHGKIGKGKLKSMKNQTFEILIASPSEDILNLELRDCIPIENETEGKSQEPYQNIKTCESIAEPIGSAQIILRNIPSAGQTEWITLKRPSQSTSFGRLRLKMSFGSDENEKIGLERHKCLVKKLFQRLLIENNNCLLNWKGNFSPEAELILKQHLIQSNLTSQNDLIAKWTGYLDVIRNNPVNFSVFDNLLDDLLVSEEESNLTKVEKKYFWNSTRILMSSCYNYIKNFRYGKSNFSSQKEILAQFHSILSILRNIEHCEIPLNLNLFPAEFYQWIETDNLTFRTVLHEAVVQGACEWFEFLATDNRPGNDTDEAKLTQMINIMEQVIQDFEIGMDFHGIFVKKQNFSYNKTVFFVYQAKITDMMETSIQKICQGIKQLNIKECYEGNIDCNSFTLGTSMCTLFFKIQHFNKIGFDLFLNDDTFETFPMRRFHTWFSSAVITWLDIAIVKAMRQIDQAVEMDDFTAVDLTNLHGSSAADVLNIIYQIRKFWIQLEWPDLEKCYSFLVKIIEDVFTVSIHYADLIIRKISNVGEEKKNYSVNEWCVAINNIDYMSHKIQQFIVNLGVDELITSLSDSKSMTAADRCKRSLSQMMKFSFEIMKQKTVDLLDIFSKEMDPSIMRFLQEGAELVHQQPKICSTLMDYLDNSLATLNSKLSSEMFHRLFNVIWERISNILFLLIEDGIEKNRPTTYFSNLKETLHVLIGFFKIEQQDPNNDKKLPDILAKNEKKLTIFSTETPELIHKYYLERLEEQETIKFPEYGILVVNLNLNNNILFVEVLNASNIIPMDSNGQSDPFVCVELIPLSKFSFFNYKTRVLKKTLHPMFDEKFSVALTKSQLQVKDALIKFIVKDRDLLSKNRFMAEAFIRLSDAGQGEPELHYLKLNRPKNLENDILKCLEVRRNHDKMAKIFLKKQKAKLLSNR